MGNGVEGNMHGVRFFSTVPSIYQDGAADNNPKDSWKALGACRGLSTELFFPENDKDAGPAKAVCATCPVRPECLDFAIKNRQGNGVWGGTSEQERRDIARRRRQATSKNNTT